MLRRQIVGALMLAGCGARTGLIVRETAGSDAAADVGDGTSVARDSAARDAGGDGACVPGWDSCHVVGSAIDLAGGALSQNVYGVWDGEELLAVYDDASSVHLVAVDPGDAVLWREEIGGLWQARVAWNRALHVGLIADSRGLQWLGADGHPAGSFVPTEIPGSDLMTEPGPTRAGFVLLSGTVSYQGDTGPELYVASVGATPSSVTWTLLHTGAPRSPAVVALDESGLANWIVSSVYVVGGPFGEAEAYPIAPDGTPGAPVDLSAAVMYPRVFWGATSISGTLYTLQTPVTVPTPPGNVYVVAPGASSTATPIPGEYALWTRDIDRIGDRVIVVSTVGDGRNEVVVFPLDVLSSGHPQGGLVVATRTASQPSFVEASLAATDRGFAVMYRKGESVYARFVECCPE